MHLTFGALFVIWLLWVLADEMHKHFFAFLVVAFVITSIAVMLGVQ